MARQKVLGAPRLQKQGRAFLIFPRRVDECETSLRRIIQRPADALRHEPFQEPLERVGVVALARDPMHSVSGNLIAFFIMVLNGQDDVFPGSESLNDRRSKTGEFFGEAEMRFVQDKPPTQPWSS